MLPKWEILQKVSEYKFVAVIRGESPDEAIAISKAVLKGGFKVLEVTYTTPHAGEVIKELVEEDGLVGAGTVLDAETARNALLHGAEFIVSPHFNRDISEICNRYSAPYFPGCLTISEMIKALENGCDVVKLFPANNLTPSFINAVNGPLPKLCMMPTGGINTSNFMDWIHAGAYAIGVGGDLTKAYRTGV